MKCTVCGVSAAQHELIGPTGKEMCHRCTAAERDKLQGKLTDFQGSFDLRWNSDMRAIAEWRVQTGKDLVWPDHTDLCVWLAGELERVKKQCAAILAGRDYISRESVKPIWDAVKFLLTQCDGKLWSESKDEWCPVPKALAAAKQLGL